MQTDQRDRTSHFFHTPTYQHMEKGRTLMARGCLSPFWEQMDELDLAVHTCSPRTWRVETGGQEFKVILGYVVSLRPAEANETLSQTH